MAGLDSRRIASGDGEALLGDGEGGQPGIQRGVTLGDLEGGLGVATGRAAGQRHAGLAGSGCDISCARLRTAPRPRPGPGTRPRGASRGHRSWSRRRPCRPPAAPARRPAPRTSARARRRSASMSARALLAQALDLGLGLRHALLADLVGAASGHGPRSRWPRDVPRPGRRPAGPRPPRGHDGQRRQSLRPCSMRSRRSTSRSPTGTRTSL